MTTPIRYYPSYEQGLDSTDFRAPNKIAYAFRTAQACQQFAEQILEWGKEGLLPAGNINLKAVQPFAKESPPFSAMPDVISYMAIISFAPSRETPYQFAGIVNALGTAPDAPEEVLGLLPLVRSQTDQSLLLRKSLSVHADA